MKQPQIHLFDNLGRAVVTTAFYEKRIADLERENERLKRIIKIRLQPPAPAPLPVVH